MVRISYIVLRVRWCNIIVSNVHASTEESDDLKDSFYVELKQAFDHFSLYHMKTLLDFNENWGEVIFSNRQ